MTLKSIYIKRIGKTIIEVRVYDNDITHREIKIAHIRRAR